MTAKKAQEKFNRMFPELQITNSVMWANIMNLLDQVEKGRLETEIFMVMDSKINQKCNLLK